MVTFYFTSRFLVMPIVNFICLSQVSFEQNVFIGNSDVVDIHCQMMTKMRVAIKNHILKISIKCIKMKKMLLKRMSSIHALL